MMWVKETLPHKVRTDKRQDKQQRQGFDCLDLMLYMSLSMAQDFFWLIVINVAAFRSSQTGINPCPWYQDGACVWAENNAGAICEDSEFSDKATLRSNSFQDPLIRDTRAHTISRLAG